MNLEFLAPQRGAKIEFEHTSGLDARVHARLEEAIGAAAVGLGAVEREIGILEQCVRIAAIVRGERDANTDADHELVAGDVIGLRDRFDQPACKRRRRRGVAAAAKLHDREFVAAEPRHRIVLGCAFGKPVRDFLQQCVSDGMAK